MKQKNTTANYKNILYLIIPSFILILAWIGFNIYGNRVKSTLTESQQKQIIPIAPNFDQRIINNLKARKQIEPILLYKEPLREGLPNASTGAELNTENTPTQKTIQESTSSATLESERGEP